MTLFEQTPETIINRHDIEMLEWLLAELDNPATDDARKVELRNAAKIFNEFRKKRCVAAPV